MVDDGAALALRSGHRSLLPAGITTVSGAFERGDVIEILSAQRESVATGLANYGSEELAKIKGLRSDRISERLGYEYGDEAVHRDNMVVG